MSRYRSGQHDRAFALLKRFSSIVSEQNDIYEGYDMNACGLQKCGCTTSGYGDYLEHCGGLIWSVVDGLFGWNFDSKSTEYVASIEPRFPSSWSKQSEMITTIRGLEVQVRYDRSGILTLNGLGSGGDDDDKYSAIRIRIVGCEHDFSHHVINDDDDDVVVLSRGVNVSRICRSE